MFHILITLLLTVPALTAGATSPKRNIDYVDPLMGMHESRWMLFPGPTMPFGMVKLSPDNQTDTVWKAGYEYTVDNIAGFNHIHDWTMAGLLTMPVTGRLHTRPGSEDYVSEPGFHSKIDHSKEKASVGYYSVLLEDYGIRAELTATTRTGFHRYTFPASDSARIMLATHFFAEYPFDVDWASFRRVSDHEVVGFSKQKTFDNYSQLNNEYTVYFVVQVDKKFDSMGTWEGDDIRWNEEQVYGRGEVGAFLNFRTRPGEVIQMKTGISFVSIEQARENLRIESEPFGWDFDAVVENCRSAWEKILGTIGVEGSETDKKKFYTNFYRAYAGRSIFSDANGKYTDMCEQVAQLPAGDVIYSSDAFWNTFWNLNQLWSLATPEVTNSWVRSLLEFKRRGGWLPNGPTGLEYCDIMVAHHEIALINSAYQKGIRNFDAEEAFRAIRDQQTIPPAAHPCGGVVGNRQIVPYMKLGYVPFGPDSHYKFMGTFREGPASNTLDYAFDDWNVAMMAAALGKKEDYDIFLRRAFNYRNIFDSASRYMAPRLADGTFVDFGRLAGDPAWATHSNSWMGTGFIEGNAWQYTWYVPHDVNALVRMLGREEFVRRLDEGFRKSEKYGFNAPGDMFKDYPINHGNQPNMQAAYLFNYAGRPYLTQKWARAIMRDYYGSTPMHGWLGDEDQGQMGAWYVMSAMGLFQMDGGGSTEPVYEIGSPVFRKVVIRLDPAYYGGGEFVIEAKNASEKNIYIQSATLNGRPLHKPWFYHRELTEGGKLTLVMGDKPNLRWGSGPDAAPPSMSTTLRQTDFHSPSKHNDR
ncbi:GH92 family glycosyl hydrolase [Rikenellaceae bacterium DSM 108975]|nr:GH92 family glycosyl hydrolase [Gallalistipes aquisgranensis]